MKKGFFIILISCFSLTIISCGDEVEEYSAARTIENTTTNDTTAPVIAEVTAVTTPTKNTTPNYTFSSTEAGTITYGGSCSSGTTSATSGNNTIFFLTLSLGTQKNTTKTETSFENGLMERDSNETSNHSPFNTSTFFSCDWSVHTKI